jgi:hypothetical protein
MTLGELLSEDSCIGCKAEQLARAVIAYHKADPQEYYFDDNLHTQVCTCPNCVLAREILEGK